MKKSLCVIPGSILVFVLFISIPLKATTPNWMNFTNGNVITDIASKGNILWIATSGGLVKYDKLTTQSIFLNKGNSGLPRNEMMALDVDPTGNLWIVTEAGLNEYDGLNWSLYDTSNGLPNISIHDVAIDQNGMKWIASSFGLITFDGNFWNVYDTSNSNISSQSVMRVFISPTGEKWMTTYAGMERFDGTNWTLYDYNVAPYSFYNATDVEFNGNDVFVATHGDFSQGEGLVKFDGNMWTDYTPLNSGLPYSRVECLDSDNSGNLWMGNFDSFGSANAIVMYDGINWSITSAGLPGIINHLNIDNNNRFFTGTMTTGCYEYDGFVFSKITTSNSGINIYGGNEIFIDDQQDVRATNYLGFTHFDRQVWEVYDTSSSAFLNSNVFSIAQDHSGNTWIGTSEGLIKFDGINWTRYDTSNSGLTDQYINAVNVDADNSVWVGTNSGPFKFDGATWTNYFSNAGSHIQHIFNTADGDVWMTSPGYGLNRFDRNNTWTNYLPAGAGGCHAGALDKNGNVWYGGNNLYKWDGNAWTTYTIANGLPWSFVTALSVDTNNILWVGTQNGLSKFDGSGFTNYFVSNSGLTANYISDIEVDVLNNKWIATSAGISVYNEGGITLGLNHPDFQNHMELSFYPNPAREFIWAGFNGGRFQPAKLIITDALGRQVSELQMPENQVKIDVAALNRGVYFCNLITETGKVIPGKFIVH